MSSKTRKSRNKQRTHQKTKKYIGKKQGDHQKVFSKKDYSSGDGFLTSVWGPPAWFFLHTISFNYPVNPTEEQKKQYKEFILSLQYVLPCRYCRENLKENLKLMPLTHDKLESRCTFSRYIYDLHELVNKRLGKKSGLSYTDVKERFEHFRSRCTVEKLRGNSSVTPAYSGFRGRTPLPNVSDASYQAIQKIETEKGCVEPLYGKKAKCLLKIVPQEQKANTIEIDKKCLKSRYKK